MCERRFRDQIVGEPVRELRQRIRGQRCDDQQIGSREVSVEIIAGRPAGKSEEGLGPDETLRTGGDQRNDLVPALDEQANEVARLVGGDPTGDADKDSSHA